MLQKASVENEKIYAALNGGQSVILAMGLTSILIAAATSAGTFTAGDLVRTCPLDCCSNAPCHHCQARKKSLFRLLIVTQLQPTRREHVAVFSEKHSSSRLQAAEHCVSGQRARSRDKIWLSIWVLHCNLCLPWQSEVCQAHMACCDLAAGG